MLKFSEYFLKPPRQTYYLHDLGNRISEINSKMVKRSDFMIQNNKSNLLSVSYYQFGANLRQFSEQSSIQLEIQGTKQPFSNITAIYLHSHHGSRIQGLSLRQSFMKMGINFCVFDFAGYGNSQGDLVSLGINQSEDIQAIVSHLSIKFNQKKFILWGRSMGAVAAILYLSKYHQKNNIICSIFDSPFSSLEKSIIQIASNNTGISQKLIYPFFYLIKKSLEGQLNFQTLEIHTKIQKIKSPGLFITSKNDKFIKYSHSEFLYQNYGGIKQLHYIQRDHNEQRIHSDFKLIFQFIMQKITQNSVESQKYQLSRTQNQQICNKIYSISNKKKENKTQITKKKKKIRCLSSSNMPTMQSNFKSIRNHEVIQNKQSKTFRSNTNSQRPKLSMNFSLPFQFQQESACTLCSLTSR